ncbi:NfeD family protein [Kocuria sp.]|uniref:NfeD family protein n=1 Tax=Kocuria sp. TaxID=1871328 RepID=UPI0026DFCE75|nr:NfeD family protein [Kocuria sp.]MDO5619659.1 NfeD family protein [Kocuria sp.]
MLEWILMNGWVIWLIIALLLGVVEILTLDLTFLMLAGGALAASILSAVSGGNLILEVLTFAAVSVLLIFAIRPRLLRRLHQAPGSDALSNTDRLPGQPCLVLEPVTAHTGLVRLDGDVWTARAEGDHQYQVDQQVFVQRVNGATVVVTHVPLRPAGPTVEA